MKRIAIAAVVILLLGGVGLALLARSVFTGDNVRAAIAEQLSDAIGQPVTIGGLSVSIYPRVTMDLTDVAIGAPGQLHLASMHVGTGLRPLFSRRIERAAVRIDGARITLPLPALGGAAPTASRPEESGAAPVEIVSIDEVVLRNVEVMSGGRALRGDIELVPTGDGVQIRRVALSADDTAIEMTGALTSLSPLAGQLDASAESVDFDRLLAFLTDFSAGTPAETAADAPAGSAPATAVDGRLIVALRARGHRGCGDAGPP